MDHKHRKVLLGRLGWITLLCLSACSGPIAGIPGGTLKGEVKPLSQAPALNEEGVLVLETNPEKPYSVNVGFRLIEGRIYLDPTAERRWYQHLRANPAVRVRLPGSEVLYTAYAVPAESQAIIDRFEPDRQVIQLRSRP